MGIDKRWLWSGLAVFLFIYAAIHSLNQMSTLENKSKIAGELDKSVTRKATPFVQIRNDINGGKRIAPPSPFMPSVTVQAQPAVKAVAAIVKKDDKKADKKDDKKKKKEKKADPKVDYSPFRPMTPTSGAPNNGSPAGGSMAGGGPPPPPKNNASSNPVVSGSTPTKTSTLPTTLNGWIAEYLNPPTYESVSQLVSFFAAGQMSQSTFYSLTDHLMQGSNTTYQQYGVFALGSFNNTQSFEMLVTYRETETNAPLVTQMTNLINGYTKGSYVNYAAAALSDTNTKVQYYALATIQSSAQLYLSNTPQSTGGAPISNGGATYFKGIVTYLTSYIAQEKDPTLLAEANSTLSSIQTLLASSSPTSAPGSTVSTPVRHAGQSSKSSMGLHAAPYSN